MYKQHPFLLKTLNITLFAFHICLKQYMQAEYLSVYYQCSLVGTFVPEDDKVIYGLTHPINTFDILSVEVR